jgi:hypothetical protein
MTKRLSWTRNPVETCLTLAAQGWREEQVAGAVAHIDLSLCARCGVTLGTPRDGHWMNQLCWDCNLELAGVTS